MPGKPRSPDSHRDEQAPLPIQEGFQRFPGQPLLVLGPVAPLKLRRDGRHVAVHEQFLLLVLVVHDFEEEEPSQLLDALATGSYRPDSYRPDSYREERPRSSRPECSGSRMDLIRLDRLGMWWFVRLC